MSIYNIWNDQFQCVVFFIGNVHIIFVEIYLGRLLIGYLIRKTYHLSNIYSSEIFIIFI